ncbi:hypothetical protein FQA39_LY03796 [Lamprigera yunnana]|nr:hypothetical protein FQA39_LY03796 [Lamprigera yunnana]
MATVTETDTIYNVSVNIVKIFPDLRGSLKQLFADLNKLSQIEQVQIVNDFLDERFNELKQYRSVRKYKSINLPDIKKEYEHKFFFMSYTRILTLSCGLVYNMEANRQNDIVIEYQQPIAKITAPFCINNVKFSYHYESKFMGLYRNGTLEGEIQNQNWIVDLTIDSLTLSSELNSFELTSIGKITIKFVGNGLTDWIINLLATMIIPLLHPIIKKTFQNYMGHIIKRFWRNYNEHVEKSVENEEN